MEIKYYGVERVLGKLTLSLVIVIAFSIVAVVLNTGIPSILGGNRASWTKAITLTDDNVLIDILYAEPSKPRQVVVMVHDIPYTFNKDMWRNLDVASRLLNYDSIVVLFDLRFHGNSTPVLASGSVAVPYEQGYEGYVRDISSVVSWAKKNFNDLPIILVGYGESGKYVLEYAVGDPSVRGVALLFTKYVEVEDLVKEYGGPLLVLSDDFMWKSVRNILFIEVLRDVAGNPMWSDYDLDIFFNWIKNLGAS